MIPFIIIIFLLSSINNKSIISTDLFNTNYLGNINEIHYLNSENPKEILTFSNDMINKIDLQTNQIKFSKLLSNTKNQISVNDYIIMVINNNSYSDLYYSSTGILANSFDNFKNINKFNASYVNKNQKEINFVSNEKQFKIFNSGKKLFEINLNNDNDKFFLDFNLNEDKKIINYLILNNNKYEIYEINMLTISISKPNVTKFFENQKQKENVILKENYIYIIKKNIINIINIDNNKINSIKIDENIENIYKDFLKPNFIIIKTNEKIYLIENENILNKYNIKNYSLCSSSRQSNSLLCINNNLNLIKYSEKNEKKYNLLTEMPINNIQVFSVFPYNGNIITIVDNNIIFQFELNEDDTIIKYNSMFKNIIINIVYSELISINIPNQNLNNKNNLNQYSYSTINNLKTNFDIVKILTNMINIIISDFKTLIEHSKNILNEIIGFIKNRRQFMRNFKNEKMNYGSIYNYLFLYTSDNYLYVLNAYNGNILYINKFSGNLIKISKNDNNNYFVEPSVDITFEENKNFITYKYLLLKNKIEFQNSDFYELKKNIISLQKKLIQNKNNNGYINLSKEIKKNINNNEKAINYLNDKYSFYAENNSLYAFKFNLNQNDLMMSLIFNFNYEKLIAYKTPNININAPNTYLNDGKIFYKYINNNLVYIISMKKTNLVFTIIHGQNGKIIEEQVIRNVDGKSINYAFEDNWGVITYKKNLKTFTRNEIFSFELMKSKIETSLMSLFKKYYNNNNNNKNNKNNLFQNFEDIEILTNTFVSSRAIKKISISSTLYSNSNKFVIFTLDNDMLYLVDKRELSPRRPYMIELKGKKVLDPEKNSIYVDNEFKPYNPVIEIDYNYVIFNENDKVKNIGIGVTENESTFLLCIIGNNINCKKVYPDKMYDKLNRESFKAEVIVLFTFIMILVIYSLRKYSKNIEFKNLFLGIKYQNK